MPTRRPYGEGTGLHVEWVTIRHRTVYLLLVTGVAVLMAGAAVYYFVFHARPAVETESTPSDVSLRTSAHFVEIIGNVRVRKAGTYAWIDAQMEFPLQRDDHVRTGLGLVAKVAIALRSADELLIVVDDERHRARPWRRSDHAHGADLRTRGTKRCDRWRRGTTDRIRRARRAKGDACEQSHAAI